MGISVITRMKEGEEEAEGDEGEEKEEGGEGEEEEAGGGERGRQVFH